jgi:hypothetical protein
VQRGGEPEKAAADQPPGKRMSKEAQRAIDELDRALAAG